MSKLGRNAAPRLLRTVSSVDLGDADSQLILGFNYTGTQLTSLTLKMRTQMSLCCTVPPSLLGYKVLTSSDIFIKLSRD